MEEENVFKMSEKRREISYIKRTKFNSIFLLSYPIFGGVYDLEGSCQNDKGMKR
ncbi:MAG: hypothetical protein HYW01_03695 [Deltaproteobacteria bacterium]|nr:hypothetical protein [Deltaproteobacteria bacterium]